jgi:hypothetical protein
MNPMTWERRLYLTAHPFAYPLLRAVQSGLLGDLTVPELLEYSGFSRSKLEHYVEDPVPFARRSENTGVTSTAINRGKE